MNKWLDKVLLLAALAIAGATAYYAVSNRQTQPVSPSPIRGGAFERELPVAVTTEVERQWQEPATQQDNWIFEVFTPPRIFFYQETARFVIELPAGKAPEPPPSPFGMDLVEIKRDAFRIQLVGYSGDIGNFRIADLNVRGRAGRVFADEKFEIVSVSEERVVEVDKDNPNLTPKISRRGVAVIKELTDGQEYRLVSGEVTYNAKPVAELDARVQDSREKQTKLMLEGDSWEVNQAKYTLLSINEEESSVAVKKEALDGSGKVETETLKAMGRLDILPQYNIEYQDEPGSQLPVDAIQPPADFFDVIPTK